MNILTKIRTKAHDRAKWPKNETVQEGVEYLIEELYKVKGDNDVYFMDMATDIIKHFDAKLVTKKASKDPLAWVAQSTSKDISRKVLSVVKFDEDGTLIATDGRRVHIVKNFKSDKQKPDHYYDKMGREILIDGNYPNWKQVIPASYEKHVDIKILEKEVYHYDSKSYKAKVIKFKHDGVIVSLNYKFYSQAIAIFENPILSYNSATSPVRISDKEEDPEMFAILMPMNLQ